MATRQLRSTYSEGYKGNLSQFNEWELYCVSWDWKVVWLFLETHTSFYCSAFLFPALTALSFRAQTDTSGWVRDRCHVSSMESLCRLTSPHSVIKAVVLVYMGMHLYTAWGVGIPQVHAYTRLSAKHYSGYWDIALTQRNQALGIIGLPFQEGKGIIKMMASCLPNSPAIVLLGIYPREVETQIHTKICIWMFMVVLLVIPQNWNGP